MRTRLVELDDAPALIAILNPEIISSMVTFDLTPRSVEEQEEWIAAHAATHPCVVAVNEEDDRGEPGARGEKILGFASLSPFRERPGYSTTVEDSVYVHRDARGRGVGERLMRELLVLARAYGFHSVIARITSDNAGSIRLHERVGFGLVGTEIEVGRKHGHWLDVVEYQFVMSDESR